MKIANDLDSVSCAFEYAEKFFINIQLTEGFDDVLFATNIVLDEIISNIVKYSKSNSDIDVELTSEDDSVKLVIKDNGIAFNPLKSDIPVPSNQKIENVPIGKLGITIVKNIAEKISYERNAKQNILTVWLSKNKKVMNRKGCV